MCWRVDERVVYVYWEDVSLKHACSRAVVSVAAGLSDDDDDAAKEDCWSCTHNHTGYSR